MKAVTAAEMREIDRITIEERVCRRGAHGHAGKAVADCINTSHPNASRIALFCGRGNNGGDGFVAAYWLAASSRDVRVFLVTGENPVTRSTSLYCELCEKNGIAVNPWPGASKGAADLAGFDLIVDALIGTGFTGQPRAPLSNCDWRHQRPAR
jgi:NAD(P)H-hydrate epimerase